MKQFTQKELQVLHLSLLTRIHKVDILLDSLDPMRDKNLYDMYAEEKNTITQLTDYVLKQLTEVIYATKK